ncbi:hypothetical protein [Streptomyces sp. KMM 9044]|uniref:hypothetical protein n=1 Tax=Streptomyces sp. KMM 9044 TaxID=2744474 RepID=UPI002150C9A8|nr:hypothetical protein [Streptomyces sp. KMM 9044]WAX79832.1 hypothetical protein HUV60_021325 [Streptomyces sp. KMM 9044]
MGSPRVALCAGVLAVTVLAPTAYAVDGDAGVSVTPTTPAPGTDVILEVTECAERTAVAVSSAFVSEVRLTVADGVLVGESRVRSTLTAGTYPVLVGCGERARQGTITVAPARNRPTQPTEPAGTSEPAEPSKPGAAEPAAPASPVAPVDAGGGGTAPLAATGADEDGPGAAQALTGLFLAAAAAGAVVRGRVRRERGTTTG